MATATATATKARTTPAPAAAEPESMTPAHAAAVARADSLRATSQFARPADEATIEGTAAALRDKGYDVRIAANGDEARRIVVELLPEGAEVGQGASQTLEQTGITHELEESGRFDPVRKRTRSMDRSTPEGLREMRKAGVAPDWYVNSAHAITLDGTIVLASNTGSQLAPIAFGAGEVIFVVGSQKLVSDLDTAMRRLEEHSLPLENARMQGIYGINSDVKKVLVIHREFRPDRFRVIIVREPVGA